MDAVYTYRDYTEDSRPRLQFPKRTGRRTTYEQWLSHQFSLHHEGKPPAAQAQVGTAPVIVNHGRWLWQCPGCFTAVQVHEDAGQAQPLFCPSCFGQEYVRPVFPDARAEIEEELLRQPGYRWNAPFRNWEPGWSLAHLRDRTAKAQAQLDAGATFVRAASIGTPRTWSVGEVLTASNMNTFVREIQKDLIGSNGPVELLHGMRPGSFSTAELNALSGVEDGTMFYDSSADGVKFQKSSGIVPVGLLRHTSPTFALNAITTVTHNLGVAPALFQLLVERVASHTAHGYATGDQIYMTGLWQGLTGGTNDLQMHDVTTSSYKVYGDGGVARIKNNDPETSTADERIIVDNDDTTNSSQTGWGARLIAFA